MMAVDLLESVLMLGQGGVIACALSQRLELLVCRPLQSYWPLKFLCSGLE